MDSDRPRTHGYVKCTSLVLADVTPRRLWSAQFAIKPVTGAIKIKPDLILCASDPLNKTTLTWMHVISIMEVTSKPNDLDMLVNLAQKAYVVFVNQPGRCFLILVSIAAQIFRIHLYDRSGVIHSCGYNIHANADLFTSVLRFLTSAPPKDLGYNPTFTYSGIVPQSPSSPPVTIHVGTKIYVIIRIIFLAS